MHYDSIHVQTALLLDKMCMDVPTVARIGSNDPSLRALSLEPNDFEDVEEFMQVIPNTQGTAGRK